MTSSASNDKNWNFLRILVLATVALLVFILTALPLVVLLSWIRDTPLLVPDAVVVSVAAALLIWAIVARFHIRNHKITMQFSDREAFLDRVKTQLGELGYEMVRETDARVAFRPAFHSRLFGGSIHLDFDLANARITGPKVYVESLQKRLRNQTFLEPLQRSLAESRKPRTTEA